MKYKYAKMNRQGVDFTLVQSFGKNDGDELQALIKKHDPYGKNVIMIRKLNDGRNEFTGSDVRKFDYFSSTESFDNLDWLESFID